MPAKIRNLSPRELAVSKMLHEHWDPIGCGVPEDEYDSYAPFVAHLLCTCGDEGSIVASFLRWVRRDMMSLSGQDPMLRDVSAAVKVAARRDELMKLSNDRP